VRWVFLQFVKAQLIGAHERLPTFTLFRLPLADKRTATFGLALVRSLLSLLPPQGCLSCQQVLENKVFILVCSRHVDVVAAILTPPWMCASEHRRTRRIEWQVVG
jgi:hypothetical protein